MFKNNNSLYYRKWNKDEINKEFVSYEIIECKNIPLFIHVGYDLIEPEYSDEVELWGSLYVPHKKSSQDKLMWRDLHTGLDKYLYNTKELNEMINANWEHNNISYGFESSNDYNELLSKEEIIQATHNHDEKSTILDFEQINNIDCIICIGKYKDEESRVFQYIIKNINNSKYLKDETLIISASYFIHDYTHYRTLRSFWKKLPLIIPHDKKINLD